MNYCMNHPLFVYTLDSHQTIPEEEFGPDKTVYIQTLNSRHRERSHMYNLAVPQFQKYYTGYLPSEDS